MVPILLIGFFSPSLKVNVALEDICSVLSLSLISCGALYRAYVIGYRQIHSSGRNRSKQVAESLNSLDAYSMSQHPLYFANALIWCGALISFHNFFVLGAGLVFFILFIWGIISSETRFLSQSFGPEYAKWQLKTPVFFPNPFKFRRSAQSFEGWRVLATEYPTWVSILAVLWCAQLYLNLLQTKQFSWSSMSGTLALITLLVGLLGRFCKYVVILRWLKKSI